MAESSGGADRFATTRWSVVLRAGGGGGAGEPAARDALARLCATYWYPLYAYIRRGERDPNTAEDLTQGFFACFLEARGFAGAEPGKGRFRSYLLASAKHFLANERDKARALKRGGDRKQVPFELASAEERYGREPVDTRSPEHIYERRWALTVLDTVLDRLRAEYAQDNREAEFDALRESLLGDGGAPPQADIARALDCSPANVRVKVHRLRRRYRALLREEVAGGVEDPAEVADEIRHLFRALEG